MSKKQIESTLAQKELDSAQRSVVSCNIYVTEARERLEREKDSYYRAVSEAEYWKRIVELEENAKAN